MENKVNTQKVIETFSKYVIGNYNAVRLNRCIVKGQGSYIWDADGNKILDMFPGWAVSAIGHCHPKVVSALQKQAGELLHIDNTFYNEKQGQLAEMISQRGFGGKCFFCNSGAEANEAALKLARLHTAESKYKFITAYGSFHGRTFATASATGQPNKHKGLLPMMPGFIYVPFNDVNAVRQAFTDEVCGVMIEPVQGEGGINIATNEYLQAIRQLCNDNNAVMILDEVQTYGGRTGKWFGYQHYNVEPDIVTMAKALGGGVPIGAIMAKPEVAESLVSGTHASTYGGNPLACAAAIAAIQAVEDENMLENAVNMGKYICDKLDDMAKKHSVIAKVKALGLMIGIELNTSGSEIVSKALEKGLRINCTQGNIIRFMPCINVTADQADKALEIFDSILS